MRNGRKGNGRQRGAWPVSLLEPVTFPGSAGARPPYGRQAIADARRPSQRPRVYRFGKPETARNAVRRSDAGCASGSFFGGSCGESTAPGAASTARAGVRVSFAGRSAVLRRGRSGPACLRNALRCSCRAVACGDRGVSFDMGRRPLVRRRWCRGSPFPARPGCLPGPATTSFATTVPASIKDSALSRRAPRAVRRSREVAALPCSMPMPPVLTGRPMAHPDSPPPPFSRVAHPCPMPVHLPGDSRMP